MACTARSSGQSARRERAAAHRQQRLRARDLPAAIAFALAANVDATLIVVVGVVCFGVAFAVNSAVHSYLILRYADGDRVAMNVGFYYMANAGGRFAGTILSGLLYQWKGLEVCLWVSVGFVLGAGGLSLLLPHRATSPFAAAAV